MKKTLLGLLLLSISCAFAQTPKTSQTTEPTKTSETPDLGLEIQNYEQMTAEFAKKIAGKGKISIFVRTEEDKFIRIYSSYPNARGTELNSKIAKVLASKGHYESQDEVLPELGVQCNRYLIKLSKDNKIAMSYGEGCVKNP